MDVDVNSKLKNNNFQGVCQATFFENDSSFVPHLTSAILLFMFL